MYSGTTFHNLSGNIAGTHQKINRVARKKLARLSSVDHFPTKRMLTHFEGRNGPDGIKAKSPGQNEPWHFYDPFDPGDGEILATIRDHYKKLVKDLKADDMEKAAFEAAWLSHAIVDGLTPAHHFPLEEELAALRLGEGNETRVTVKDKIKAKGETKRETLKNNWLMWGAKGLMTNHMLYEGGVATIVAPLTFRNLRVSKKDVKLMEKIGLEEYFKRTARDIALMNMYENFNRYGWTTKLARQTRHDLMPKIITTVTCAWYLALEDAGLATEVKDADKRRTTKR